MCKLLHPTYSLVPEEERPYVSYTLTIVTLPETIIKPSLKSVAQVPRRIARTVEEVFFGLIKTKIIYIGDEHARVSTSIFSIIHALPMKEAKEAQ